MVVGAAVGAGAPIVVGAVVETAALEVLPVTEVLQPPAAISSVANSSVGFLKDKSSSVAEDEGGCRRGRRRLPSSEARSSPQRQASWLTPEGSQLRDSAGFASVFAVVAVASLDA